MKIQLTVLGGFQVRTGAGTTVTLPIRKTQALLAFLALPSGRAHPRDTLAALLWGDSGDAEARGSLRTALMRLRRDLPPAARRALVTRGDTIALDPALVEVDAVEFGRAVAAGTPEALERAAALYRGDLLAGISVAEPPFEEWLVAERERLRELAVAALGKQLERQTTGGGAERAVQTALALLALDPLQEAVHRTLMRLYGAQGRRGAALRQYQACVTVLQRELGAAPDAATQQVYKELLQRSAAPRAERGVGVVPGPPIDSTRAPMIGRSTEWAALTASLDDTLAGHGQLLLLLGEAGIGKSALVAALAAETQRRGARLLLGRAHESEQILPLGPWVHAIRGAQVVTDAAVVGRLEPVWRAELARLFPELSDAPAAGDDSLRLFESVVHLGQALTADGAVVLILEDVHWADEQTLRLAAFFARRLRDRPVTVVLTARDEELGATPVLRRVVDELRREPHLRQLRIGPLSAADTASLVRALARTGTDGGVLARVSGQVWRLSEGNPFVVVETMRALEQGSASAESRTVVLPERVQQVISARLDRLSSGARSLVMVAAVIGREFEFPLLARAAGVSDGEGAETLEELVRRGVLHATGEAFDFTHDRIRDVASAEILAPRRRLLHRQIAAAMEAVYAANVEPYHAALATHYREGEVWDKAHPYLRLAGAQAATRAAHREAVSWLEQALAALARVPETRATLEQAIDLRLALRSAYWPLGGFEAIGRHLDAAEAEANRLGDQARLGWTAAYRSSKFWFTGQEREALACGERARRIAAGLDDRRLRFAADIFFGHACIAAGDHQRAIDVLRPLLDGVDDDLRRDRLGLAGYPVPQSSSWLAHSLAERGEFAEAFARGRDAVRVAEALDHPHTIVVASRGLAEAHGIRGDLPEAIALMEHGLALCREWKFTGTSQTLTGSLGHLYALSGRVGEGLTLLHEAFERAGSMAHGLSHAWIAVKLAEVSLFADRPEDARRFAGEGLALARSGGQRGCEAQARRVLGSIAARMPAAADAETHYQAALDLAGELGMRPLVAHCHFGLGRLHAQAGHRAAAHGHMTSALAMYGEMDMPAWRAQVEAAVAGA